MTPEGLNEEWKLTRRRLKVMEGKHRLLKGVVKRQVAGFKKVCLVILQSGLDTNHYFPDQTISEQSSALANLEALVAAQQSLITSQNEKLKAQDKKIDDLVAKWNGDSEPSRKRQRVQDGLDDEDGPRPRSSKRVKKITP